MAEAPAVQPLLTPPICAVMHAWTTQGVKELFQREADRRGIHVDELLRRIVTHVAADDLFFSVLDAAS